MEPKTMTLENFENLCRPSAELLEEQLHDWTKSQEEWNLVFAISPRPLMCWVEGKGWYLGIILPASGNGWDFPLLQLIKK